MKEGKETKRQAGRYGAKVQKIAIPSAQSPLPLKSQEEKQHCGVIDLTHLMVQGLPGLHFAK